LVLSAAAFSQEPCNIGSYIAMPLIGAEDPINLFQFAYPCSYYLLNNSNIIIANHLHPSYYDDRFTVVNWGAFTAIDYGGICPSAGTIVIALCHYSENTGVNQRAWYAVSKIILTTDMVMGNPASFIEVPSASAILIGDNVKISWNGVPSDDAVIGYRVIRSANGLDDWAIIGDTENLYLYDQPGIGTWYYAVEVKFAGSPITYVSRHGLSAKIIIPGGN